MLNGEVVEEGRFEEVFAQPKAVRARLSTQFPLPVIDPLWLSRPNPAI
jgi:hypothetical protein